VEEEEGDFCLRSGDGAWKRGKAPTVLEPAASAGRDGGRYDVREGKGEGEAERNCGAKSVGSEEETVSKPQVPRMATRGEGEGEAAARMISGDAVELEGITPVAA
ncbi:unnamed protein product, partial [Laminaria digitata]